MVDGGVVGLSQPERGRRSPTLSPSTRNARRNKLANAKGGSESEIAKGRP
jgi:hypothetical protein